MDAEELEAIEELKAMSKDELDKVPYDIRYWRCGVGKCKSISKVRDYGIPPFYWWRGEWIDITDVFRICGKHWKMYRSEWKKKSEGRIPEEINLCMAHTKEEIDFILEHIDDE